MRFDFISFLIGFGVATGIGVVLFLMRKQIAALTQTAGNQAGATQKFITNSAESRYFTDLLKTLNATHIAGELAELTQVYVEPQFIRAIEPIEPDSDKGVSVFHVIPLMHDIPASYAP